MRAVLDIHPGVQVFAAGREYVIKHVLDMRYVLCNDVETQAVQQIEIASLRPVPGLEPLRKGRIREDLTNISDAEWEKARERYEAIKPLIGMDRYVHTNAVSDRAKEVGRSRISLYRWLQRFESEGKLSALLTGKSSGGAKKRLDPAVEAIIENAIEEEYLTPQRKTAAAVCRIVKKRCENAKLKPPHHMSVRNRIAAIDATTKALKRHGKKAAEVYEATPGTYEEALFPLAVVQIDHTKLDIMLVDDEYRLPIGRPWITLAIDVFSRMVHGFYVSFDSPSAMSVGLCMVRAMLPKDEYLRKLDIDTPWDIWGQAKALHADNGKDFKGRALERACEEWVIDTYFRPKGKTRYGAHIERLMDTFLTEIHQLPGSTFADPKDKGEYDSEKHAVMTLREFERWLTHFIVGVYHQRYHHGLGMTPITKFEEGIFGTDEHLPQGLPTRIVEEERFTVRLYAVFRAYRPKRWDHH